MSKQNRGRALWKLPSHGRGTCPICKRTRIKLLYQLILPDGKNITVCKHCKKSKRKH